MANQATGRSPANLVTVDLQPAVEEYGELHTIEGGDAYLAVSRDGSPYQFQVYPRAEVHGQMKLADGTTSPATLLLIGVHAIPDKRAKPIEWASVQMTFERRLDAPKDSPTPEVVTFRPGFTPVKLEMSSEAQSTTTNKGVNADIGGGAGPVNVGLGADASKERTKEKTQHFSAWVEGASRPSDDRKPQRPNLVRWSLTQNESQKGSVPPRIALAVLLKRAEGKFRCHTSISVKVESRHSFKNLQDKFAHWKGDSVEYQTFTVDEIMHVYEEGDLSEEIEKIVDPQHLEALTKGKTLAGFSGIHMPQVQNSKS